VAIEGSFHGRTAAAGASPGCREEVVTASAGNRSKSSSARRDLDAVARVIGTDTAAVIAEPVQGVAAPWTRSAIPRRAARALQ